jgi:hypothetical protein
MPERPNTVDIDQMIAALPHEEQVMVKKLRALVIECIPQATEKSYYDFGIPFYRRNRLICFIWPPSVVWEPGADHEKRKGKGVSLGFNQGNLMSNEDGVLLAEGRKQVYVMYFKKLNDIDEARVRSLLFEAAMIDEQFTKNKKRNKR